MLMRGMARCYLALVLQQRGTHAQSLDAFREADRLMSQQDDSKAAFARCLSAQAYAEAAAGRYPEAIDVLERSDKLLRASVGPKRSEEHTSELQSLMRISYAVFCLK